MCDAVRGVGSPAQCPQARRPHQQCLLWYFSRAGFAGVSPRAQVTSGWYLGPVSLLCWNGLSARPRAPSKGPGQTGADGREPPAAGALGKGPGGFQSGLFFASRTNATKSAEALDAGRIVTGRVARAGLRFPWGAPSRARGRLRGGSCRVVISFSEWEAGGHGPGRERA